MIIARKVALLVTAAWLGGCATPVPVVDFYDTDSDTLDRFRDVRTVYEREGFDDLGEVQGLHCSRNGITPSPHSPEARARAIDQVRLKAAARGADAITEPHCRISGDVDLTNNCTGSVLCISHALRQRGDQHHRSK